MESLEKLRGYAQVLRNTSITPGHNPCADAIDDIADEIEGEIADNYIPKNNAEIDKTAVQEYNLTVHVADGQTIEYNTELRHRCGAATSMSVAFRLE